MENEQIKSCRAQFVIFKEHGEQLQQNIDAEALCIIDTPNGIQLKPYCVLPRSTICGFVPINFAVALSHDYGDNSISADIIKFHKDRVLEDGYILYAMDTPVFAVDNKGLGKSDTKLYKEAIDFLRDILGHRFNTEKLHIRYL